MNTQKRIISTSAYLLLSLFVLQAIFSGCKKNGPTKAVVTVNDSLGRPCRGATVTLWQDTAVNQTTGSTASIRVTKLTDSGGKAEFEFALEAFLNLEAYKNTDTVRAFVRLEEHKTVYQTVNF